MRSLIMISFLFFTVIGFSQNHYKPYSPNKYLKTEYLGARYSDGVCMIRAYYIVFKNQSQNQLELVYSYPKKKRMLVLDRTTKHKAVGFLKNNNFQLIIYKL